MKRIYTWLGVGALALIGAGVLTMSAGCEWTTGGGVDWWNNPSNLVDYSGSYKAPDNGYLVREFGTVIVTNTVSETLGTGNGTNTEFSGVLGQQLVSGTLTILAGGYRITDSSVTSNQSGTVSLTVTPSDGTLATLNYGTRAWTIKFVGPLASGTPILATYSSLETQSDTHNQGNHGKGIYTFVLIQTGDRLQIIDNNNSSYVGTIGNSTAAGSAQFSVTGVSQGYNVQIVGMLSSATIKATFVEEGGYTADVNGLKQ